MSTIINVVQVFPEVTLEARARAWGEEAGQDTKRLTQRAQQAWIIYLDWLRDGHQGDFPKWLAAASGQSRATCWRRWRAGRALAHGADPQADQTDLVDAARAIENGATVEEVNAALAAERIGAVRDLANVADEGHVGRRMTEEAASLRDRVHDRLARTGLDHLPREERDVIVYAAFLEVSDDALERVVAAYRRTTEAAPDEGETA